AAGRRELAPHVDRRDRMARRQRGDLIAPIGGEDVPLDDQAAGAPFDERGEGIFDLRFLARSQDENLTLDLACRGFDFFLIFGRFRSVWVGQNADRRVLWNELAEKLQAFREQRAGGHRDARDIAPGPAEAGDHAGLQDDIAAEENDRNGGCAGGCRFHDSGPAGRSDHRHAAVDQIADQSRQSLVATFRPAVFDEHILPVDVAGFAEALVEQRGEMGKRDLRSAIEKSDHRYRRLLRSRRERPGSRAASQPNDPPPAKIAHGVAPSACRPGRKVTRRAQSVYRSWERPTGGWARPWEGP